MGIASSVITSNSPQPEGALEGSASNGPPNSEIIDGDVQDNDRPLIQSSNSQETSYPIPANLPASEALAAVLLPVDQPIPSIKHKIISRLKSEMLAAAQNIADHVKIGIQKAMSTTVEKHIIDRADVIREEKKSLVPLTASKVPAHLRNKKTVESFMAQRVVDLENKSDPSYVPGKSLSQIRADEMMATKAAAKAIAEEQFRREQENMFNSAAVEMATEEEDFEEQEDLGKEMWNFEYLGWKSEPSDLLDTDYANFTKDRKNSVRQGSDRCLRVYFCTSGPDVETEAHVMRTKVFPVISEFASSLNIPFVIVEPRRGVAAANFERLCRDPVYSATCIREIHRCRQISPILNMISIVGDRFGTMHAPTDILAREYTQITNLFGKGVETDRVKDSKLFLDKFYRRDLNSLPARYRLNRLIESIGPCEQTAQFNEYSKREEIFCRELARAGKYMGLGIEAHVRLLFSRLGKELYEGYIREDISARHNIFIARTIQKIPLSSPKTAPYIDVLGHVGDWSTVVPDLSGPNASILVNSEASLRLSWCKKKIFEKLHRTRCISLTAKWRGAAPSDIHCRVLAAASISAMKQTIEMMNSTLVPWSLFASKETCRYMDFKHPLTLIYDDFALIERLSAYISVDQLSSRGPPMFITGVSGSGLTRTAQSMEKVCLANVPYGTTVHVRVGSSMFCHESRGLVQTIVQELDRSAISSEPDNPIGIKPDSISNQYYAMSFDMQSINRCFMQRLSEASQFKPIIIIIDGAEKLGVDDAGQYLSWLPEELPDGVRVIVTFANDVECGSQLLQTVSLRANLPIIITLNEILFLGTPLNGVLPMIEKRVRNPTDNLTCSGALQTHQRDNLVAGIVSKSENLHLVRALLEQGPASCHWLPVADKIKSPAEILSAFVDSRLRLLSYTDSKAKMWTEAGIAAVSFFEWGFSEQLLLVAMQDYVEKSVGSFRNSEEFVDREAMNNIGMNAVSFILSLLEPLMLVRVEMDSILFQLGSMMYCDNLLKYAKNMYCARMQAVEDEAESTILKIKTSRSGHEQETFNKKMEHKFMLIRGESCLAAAYALEDFVDSGRPSSLKSFSVIRCIQKMQNWIALKSYFCNAFHIDSAVSSGCGSVLAQLVTQAYFSESSSIISELNLLMDGIGDLAVSSVRATIPACLNLADTCDLCKSAAASLLYLKEAMILTAEDIKRKKSLVSPYFYDPLSKFALSIRRQAHRSETYSLCKYPGVWNFMSLLPWCLHYNKPRSQDTMRNGFTVSLVGAIACSELSDPRYFVVACRDGSISAWNVMSGSIASQFKVKCCPSCLHSQSGTSGGGAVAVGCEDGSLIAFAAVALRNGESFSLKAPHAAARVVHDSQVTGVAWFAPNQLLSCSFDGLVQSWTTVAEGIFGDLTLVPNKQMQLDDKLTCLAASPPGRFPIFACAGMHGVIRICRSDFMDERSSLYGHIGNITALNFSSKGTVLVSCASDGCVRLWAGATSREWRHVGELPYSTAAEPFFSAAITGSGGNKVVAGSKFGPIFIWTVPGEPYKFGNVNTTVGHLSGRLTGHIMRVNCIQTLSDLSGVASCSTDGTLRIWNVKYESSGAKETMQAEHTRKVVMLHLATMPEYGVLSLGHPSQLSPGLDAFGTEIPPFIKTALVISSSGASDCKFWDEASEVCVGSIWTTDGGIVFGKIFNRSELLLVATDKGTVLLFSLTPTPPADSKSSFSFRSTIIGRTKLFNCSVSCGEIDRTESFIVMGSTKGHVKVLALPELIEIISFKRVIEAKVSKAEQFEKRASRKRQPKDVEKAPDIGVLSVLFSVGADIVVAAFADLVVVTWKVSNIQPIMLSPICPYSAAPKTAAFVGLHALCPYGVVPVGGIIQFWRLGLQCKFEFCLRLINRSAAFTCCCFSPDASFLITGSDDGRLLIWNLKSKSVAGSFQCQNSISIVTCDNTWPLLAAGDGAGRLYFFRYSQSSEMHMLLARHK